VTPIFITIEQVPASMRFLIHLNPLSAVVTSYRDVLLWSQRPSLPDLAWLATSALAVFILGGLLFRQLKRGFADVL
jgi:ABC-type polysaccharide/polyol phosphate export permease